MKINRLKIAATCIVENTSLFGFLEGRRLLLKKKMKSEVKDRELESKDAGTSITFCWSAEKHYSISQEAASAGGLQEDASKHPKSISCPGSSPGPVCPQQSPFSLVRLIVG